MSPDFDIGDRVRYTAAYLTRADDLDCAFDSGTVIDIRPVNHQWYAVLVRWDGDNRPTAIRSDWLEADDEDEGEA